MCPGKAKMWRNKKKIYGMPSKRVMSSSKHYNIIYIHKIPHRIEEMQENLDSRVLKDWTFVQVSGKIIFHFKLSLIGPLFKKSRP